MRQSEVFPYYRETCEKYRRVYKEIKSLYGDNYVEELALLRGYPNGSQRRIIEEMELGSCEITDLSQDYHDLGLVTKHGDFLLQGRYIVPVEDVAGNLISLIGYYPDNRKYITAPSPFFSKNTCLFNFKHAYEVAWKNYDGVVILVEGLFDCISLCSIGLPVVATMGNTVKGVKKELLKLFRKVIAIPDDDEAGRRALNRRDKKYGWQLPDNATAIKFHGGVCGDFKVKDMDDFVKFYEEDDVREILMSFSNSNEEVEDLIL